MAVLKQYIQSSIPKHWSSVHKPILFEYDMPTENCTLIDQAGYLAMYLSAEFSYGAILLKEGDLIYLKSGDYIGFHVVKSVASNIFIETKTLIVTPPSGLIVYECKYATPQVWSVAVGYTESEYPNSPYPYKVISEIQVEANKDGYLSFDVSGYVQASMSEIDIPSEPSGGVSTNYHLCMPFRILTPIAFRHVFFALNSSIDSDRLNAEYYNTNKPLNVLHALFNCGTNFINYLRHDRVETYITVGTDAPTRSGFSNGFSNGFFKT